MTLRDQPRVLTRVDEYDGGPTANVSPTQLGTAYTATQARRVVAEWVSFFAAGPSPIRELRFGSRTPARLFDSLRGQTQLQQLSVKWGDYADLSVLAGMKELTTLHLGGAVRVADVRPLVELWSLRRLTLEGLRDVHDLSPLAGIPTVVELSLQGDGLSPRIAHIDSVAFLRRMPQLVSIELIAMIVDDKDYSPLLDLPRLESAYCMRARGMTPDHDSLMSALPWRT